VLPLLKKKIETSIAVTTTNTNEFVEKYVRWKRYGWFCFCFWNGRIYSTMAALLQSGDHIVSSSSVLGQPIHCL
jgi:O-acetylhomoserine/O-acetylserine sulfhydrylase-like pyridoxal-dependent enzyme